MQTPVTVEVHCVVRFTVHDPEAVTSRAVAELRAADIDWAHEEDDLETAAAELGADLVTCVAGLADPGKMLDGVPGVEFTGGRIWAEPARDRD